MPHTDNNQPEFNREPDSNHRQPSQLLSRDIENVQASLRIDFDQKLGELANLLARFKALVSAPEGKPANDDNAQPDEVITTAAITPVVPQLAEDQPSAENVSTTDLKITSVSSDTSSANDEPAAETPQIKPASLFSPEPARFETGLYKLNCQLYRFRLELDQEMEFREEPLHIHFHQESELSKILQKISDKSSEKNPDSL